MLRTNDDVRCVVLTGAGDRAFCTGLDREGIGSIDDLPPGKLPGYNTPWDFDDPGKSVCPKTNDLWKPVIAAVNGMACGGAFYILGEVDFIIAAEHATFFDPHVTYGMPAASSRSSCCTRCPSRRSCGCPCSAPTSGCRPARAHQIGFVSEVVPADELARADPVGGAGHRRPARAGRPGHGPRPVGGPRALTQPGPRPCLPVHQHRHRPRPAGRGAGTIHLREADRLAAALTPSAQPKADPSDAPGSGGSPPAIVLVSVYCSKPSSPFCRPIPLAL